MKNSIAIGICLIFILGLSYTCGHMNGENKGYFEGIRQGRKMVQREAIAMGLAEWEIIPDADWDEFGNYKLRFKWKN